MQPNSELKPAPSCDLTHQLFHRPILTLLQHLMTCLANAQATKHAAMPDLSVEFAARHARHWAPRVLRHWHRAMLLVTGQVDFIETRCGGLNMRCDERRRGLRARRNVNWLGAVRCGDEFFRFGGWVDVQLVLGRGGE